MPDEALAYRTEDLLAGPEYPQETLSKILPLVWMIIVIRWFRWQTELDHLEAQGIKICPLMITEPLRFPANVCCCDIPTARGLYMRSHEQCDAGTTCLPRIHLPDEVHAETVPEPVAFRDRPRKSRMRSTVNQ